MAGGSLKLAVLIDGDNVSPDLMPELFDRVEDLGHAIRKNVYGAQAGSERWLEAASRFSLSQGRRHLQATGRNATDIEMVIGAMDILAANDVDGLCLVSSDSDFTSLAIRARESGKRVFGFGNEKAPDSLRNACDGFCTLGTPRLPLTQAIDWLSRAFDACAIEGWAAMQRVGHYRKQHHPEFLYRDFGCSRLKTLINACRAFEFADDKDLFRPIQAAVALTLVKTTPPTNLRAQRKHAGDKAAAGV